MTDSTDFSRSVFINCPFDEEYRPLLRSLLFTVLACGFEPRLALDRADGGEVRLGRIIELIRSTQWSIHDLSRSEPLKPEDTPRFNMPFELGLDFGCRHFGLDHHRDKQSLVLEKERYRYQKVLSDLAGCDIRAHDNRPETLVEQVRSWLFVSTHEALPSGGQIWEWLNAFEVLLATDLVQRRYSEAEVRQFEPAEYIVFAKRWLKASSIGARRRSR